MNCAENYDADHVTAIDRKAISKKMKNETFLEALLSFCDKEIKSFNRSRLFSYRKKILLAQTKILEPWEKDANLPLPDSICFPKESCQFKFDKRGIHVDGKLTAWSKIKITALAVHEIDGGRRENYTQNYFMACLENGNIINHEIGDIEEYANLLGHFIELYKLTSAH